MSVRRVLSVVPDLFFAARIAETAKTLGVTLDSAGLAEAIARARAASPDLVILDLHAFGDPLAIVRAFKADAALRAIPIVGFYSHVDAALRATAIDAGIDHVLPRSAFTARLAGILGGEMPTPARDADRSTTP